MIFTGCTFFLLQNGIAAQSVSGTKIAFLADIHLQDIYGDFKSNSFKGVYNPRSGKFATIRTMKSQLNSTRLFNENYFALLAALDDLKGKGIQLVVLPGDFTDDGQAMNVMALKKILDKYSAESGMRFFITTGNHDPVKPFGGIGGKKDFLGTDGAEQAVAGSRDFFSSLDIALSDQLNYLGYEDISQLLSDFGFFPSEKDLFWSHPFQDLDVEGYSFPKAMEEAEFSNRVYESKNNEQKLPDASYVVEPVEGVWLLALDGNIYTSTGEDWIGSSIGFNLAKDYKSHQLDWVRKVVAEAKRLNKVLISFSHYPLVDFHDGASAKMKALFGENKMQLNRVPEHETGRLFAEAGLKIHFAGHMHINDTGVLKDSSDFLQLINIQVPSLAAFPPAYKTLNFKNSSLLEIETVQLSEIDHMDEFFDLYRMEHRWLTQMEDPSLWDEKILDSKDYLQFTLNHLSGLTQTRFIPSDWPVELLSILQGIPLEEWFEWTEMKQFDAEFYLRRKTEELERKEIAFSDSLIIVRDFYLIKNGDQLGKAWIKESRKNSYEELFPLMKSKIPSDEFPLSKQAILFFEIFESLYRSLPSDHFIIDLNENSIKAIESYE